MATEEGFASALAYQHDWQQSIGGLYKREEHAARVRAEVEQKTQLYSRLLEKKDLVTPYNNKRLQSFYAEHLPKIGQFISENPDFETDIGKYAEFMRLASQMQDNDIIREELQVQKEKELLYQNRDKLTPERFNTEMERYLSYYNQDPVAEKKADPYFFNNYLVVDFNKMVNEATAALASYEYVDNEGMKHRTYQKADLKRVALDYMSNPDYAQAIETAWVESGAKEEGKYTSPLAYLEATIHARKDKSAIPTKTSGDSGPSEDFFLTQFYNKWNEIQSGMANYEDHAMIHLTPFGKAGSDISSVTLRETGPIFAMGKNGEHIPINSNVIFTSQVGEGKVITDSAGRQYVGVSVITNPSGKDTEGSRKELLNAGFETATTPGLINISTNQTANKTLAGTIYVPVNYSASGIQEYNKAFNTTEQLHKNVAGRQIDTRIHAAERTKKLLQKEVQQGKPMMVPTNNGSFPLEWSNARININTNQPGAAAELSTFEHGKKWTIFLDEFGDPIRKENGKLKIVVSSQ